MVGNAWFRLLIRGIGILLIGLAIPSLIAVGSYILSMLVNGPLMGDGQWWWTYSGSTLACLAQIGMGIYLLFFAEGLIRRCLADTIGRCPLCQYDLKGQRDATCPECGCDMAPQASAPPLPAPPALPPSADPARYTPSA